jgi:hypothetical protein
LAEQCTIGGIPADPGTERGILTEHNIAGEILAYHNWIKVLYSRRNSGSDTVGGILVDKVQ